MPGSRLTSTTGPSNPSSRKVAAAVPPALPPPTITIGFLPFPSDMRSFTLLALVAKTAPAERCWSPHALPGGYAGAGWAVTTGSAGFAGRPQPLLAHPPRSGDGGSRPFLRVARTPQQDKWRLRRQHSPGPQRCADQIE